MENGSWQELQFLWSGKHINIRLVYEPTTTTTG